MRSARLLIAYVLVNCLLLAPTWLLSGHVGPQWLALEAGLVVGICALLPASLWARVASVAFAVAVVATSLLGLGDAVIRQSLSRPMNVYLDLYLVRSLYDLLTGTLGWLVGSATLVGIVLAMAALVALLVYLLHPVPSRHARFERAGGALVLAASVVGLAGAVPPGVASRLGQPARQLVTDQIERLLVTLQEHERFAAIAASTPDSHADVPGLLQRLRGRDVILAFVESYGVSALYDPRYAPVIQPRLDELAVRLTAAGVHLATGTLVAPTQGGQSWFAHGSMLSGLWLDSQLRYDLLLASGRETLIDDFQHAGYHTVTLMPATTLAWPEGQQWGYDQILARKDIAYAGPALNWVTMPDQFTWSFLEHAIRHHANAQPLFAEVSLISSHAPWTPILPVLEDWNSIGDGSVFAPWEHAGERPADLWRDSDRVREHFALAVDYAIAAMTGYAERFVDADTLLIVMGDHQPAPLITGEAASRAVPVHVMSGDPDLLTPFLEWGFTSGALPDPNQDDVGMDQFRAWFVDAFSGDVLP